MRSSLGILMLARLPGPSCTPASTSLSLPDFGKGKVAGTPGCLAAAILSGSADLRVESVSSG